MFARLIRIKQRNTLFLVFSITGIIVFVVMIEHRQLLNQASHIVPLNEQLGNPETFSGNELWYQEKLARTEDLPLWQYTKDIKWILAWTENSPNLVVPWDKHGENLRKSGIPVEDFDAVVFNDPNWFNLSQVPGKRSPHQRYVFWTIEPPGLFSYLKLWDDSANFFNWTLTYRWDSDIISPYGFTRRKTDEEIQLQTEDLRKSMSLKNIN